MSTGKDGKWHRLHQDKSYRLSKCQPAMQAVHVISAAHMLPVTGNA